MEQLLYNIDQNLRALPDSFLFTFTVLIWMVFLLILCSNPRNKLNLWCFITGMLLSVGAVKEFFRNALAPVLLSNGCCSYLTCDVIYSVLSAVFYNLCMPCFLIFSFYFHRLDQERPAWMPWLCALVFLPAMIFSVFFPWTQTVRFQHDAVFCILTALYNLIYGILATVILLHSLRQDRLSNHYHQRRLAVVSVLLPLWVWLVSAFPYHALGIRNLDQVWKINLPVVLFVLLYCLYHAFREGIWGLRLRREQYDWSSGSKVLQKNAQYVGHALKNDLAKIEWCTELMRQEGVASQELEIIRRSVEHLRQFVNRTQLYSDRITLEPVYCDVGALLEKLTEEVRLSAGEQVCLCVDHCDTAPLFCDATHLEEALRCLVANAIEAVGKEGHICLSYGYSAAKLQAVICVADDGCGIQPDEVKKLFEPYYTTKTTNHNLGLGLYYCWNVMSAHNGSIRVQSSPEWGSRFCLYFPLKLRNRKEGVA